MEPCLIEAKNVWKRFCTRHHLAARIGLATLAHELAFFRRFPDDHPLRFKEFWALRQVNMTIRRGESIGVIGENGSGKTTLARILAGVYKPDVGLVRVQGNVTAIFAKGAGFSPALSGMENITINLTLMGLTRKQIQERLESVIDFADLPSGSLEAPVRTYSNGMKARLSFSCAVHTDPELMIIDEALAVGDLQFRTKCYNKLGEMRRKGTSFIIVSHNLKGLSQVCDRAIYMHKGCIRADGSASRVIQEYRTYMKAEGKLTSSAPASQTSEGLISKVRIHRIALLDSEGKETTQLTCGKPATLVVHCSAVENVQDVGLVAILKDEVSELGNVATLDSAAQKIKWDLEAGKSYALKAEMPWFRLGEGEYQMKVFVSSGVHHNMLDAVEQYLFDVVDSESQAFGTGIFSQEATLQVAAR